MSDCSPLTNMVFLYGNVGKEPEVNYYDNGSVVAKFSVATKRSWKDKAGVWQEKTTWHRIEAWAETAKVVESKVTKGCTITLQGELNNNSWEKDGVKHEYTYVQLQKFIIHPAFRKE